MRLVVKVTWVGFCDSDDAHFVYGETNSFLLQLIDRLCVLVFMSYTMSSSGLLNILPAFHSGRARISDN